MPGDEMGRQHITAALGGRAIAPLSHAERIEREQVHDLIQAVVSCCNSLLSRDGGTRAAERLAFYDDEFRRRDAMSAFERAEVIRRYPDLLAELRAELDR
ncbi:hypothetical protein GCM10009804_31890 [Kribbella hippodromi]|uniref:Uncharacterized protein n=1 Tax=Kribbella hippodromi TaxID=434347 RepID=A0ABN2DCH1_9ACTN